ncbi:MAG: alpha/beta hydrolase, partial [Natronospirillum sp.]
QIAHFQAERPVQVVDISNADSVGELAEQVLAQVEAPVIALAGLSMGGIVAMEVARQQSQRLAGLALLDTNPWAESETVRVAREPQMALAREGHLLYLMRETMAPKYTNARTTECRHLETVMAMAEALGPEVFIRQSRALRDRPDQIPTLRSLKGLPGIALAGTEDQLCPPDRHRAIAQAMPDCELILLLGVGHLTTLDAPKSVNQALHAWLERIE